MSDTEDASTARAERAAQAALDEHSEISIRMDKRMDVAVALVLAAVGAYAIYLATDFRIGRFPDPLTSRGFPYILGGILIVGGIVLAIRRLLRWNQLPGNMVVSEGMDDEPGHPASAYRSYAVAAAGFAWVGLLQPLGFLIMTPAALIAMLLAMGERSPAKLLGFSFGFTIVVWVTFSQVLNIMLPLGPLSQLARNMGLMY